MKPRPPAWIVGAALVLAISAPASARSQRHAPAGGGSQPAAVPRSAPAPAPAPAPSPSPAPSSSAGRDSGRGQERATSKGSDSSDDNRSTAPGRRRGNLPKTGEAAARTSPPRPPYGDHGDHGNGGVIAGGYPWWSSGYYGGYYAYDHWLGWYPTYDTTSAGYAGGDGNDIEGALRLKVKPVEASVYVDGYYVGVVDDFDGVFQRLRLEPGPHHLEIRLPEHDDLSFDVMIQPDHTTTFRGNLELRSKN